MARTPSVEYVGVLLALSLLLNSPIVNSLWTHRAKHPLNLFNLRTRVPYTLLLGLV